MPESQNDGGRESRRRPWILLIVAIACITAVLAVPFYQQAILLFEIAHHRFSDIADDTPDDPWRGFGGFPWLALAICWDPTASAAQLGKSRAASGPGIWDAGENLVLQSGTTIVHQRHLDRYRWDPGWFVRSVTVDGELDSIEVRRLRTGPDDGPAPSIIAVYGGDCRLIGIISAELVDPPEIGWRWQRQCQDSYRRPVDCAVLDDGMEALVDLSAQSFEVVERQCYDGGWSPIDWCPTDVVTTVRPIGWAEDHIYGL